MIAPEIKSTIAAKIGYASHQNSAAVVRELEVVNEGETTLENLVLELSSDPPFLETKSWRVDALLPGSTLHSTDRDVKLNADYFTELTETVSGEVRFRLIKDVDILATSNYPVQLLPLTPVLVISYDHSINYAFQQNSIPVVKELHFKNDATARKDLVIRVSTEPAFAAPVEIRLQGIDAAGEFRVAPLDLKLSHDFLAGLNERVSGWLKAEVIDADESPVPMAFNRPGD